MASVSSASWVARTVAAARLETLMSVFAGVPLKRFGAQADQERRLGDSAATL